jgi:alkylation response protein AidB-like acyl-CoA dehydrogenase
VDRSPLLVDVVASDGRHATTYTIFEGTSEIQRLVIARAISGVHIQ